MIEVVQFRPRKRTRSRQPEVSLAVEADLCNDAHLRNLIDDWIVPKMVDEWIAQADTKPLANEDNGEHHK